MEVIVVAKVSRRVVLGAGAGAVLGVSGACADPGSGPGAASPSSTAGAWGTAAGTAPTGSPSAGATSSGGSPTGGQRLIGDGSTAYTGPQPHQPIPAPLAAGAAPPQFVVLSWDGAGENGAQLFSHFRAVATKLSASMTFFLSGVYAVPIGRRNLYAPPRHPVGASDIGFFPERYVHSTIEQVGLAWNDGHEIGTHFNGHFCGANGVGTWSPQEWDREIAQAKSLVTGWRTNTGFTDLAPLPFDYERELIGGRTPCLEGQANLLACRTVQKWRYDTSGRGRQVWPTRFGNGLWNLPMQEIPFPGHKFEVISMDYNMMFNQSKTPNGDPAMRATWQAQAHDAFLAGSSAPTRATGRPTSSATTSRTGTAAATWRPWGGSHGDGRPPGRAVRLLPPARRLAGSPAPRRAAQTADTRRRGGTQGRLGHAPRVRPDRRTYHRLALAGGPPASATGRVVAA